MSQAPEQEAAQVIAELKLALLLVRRERDRLQRCVSAHHELASLSDEVIEAWAGSKVNSCPICTEIE